MNIRNYEDFWSLVVDVWTTGVFGVDLGRIIIAIGIVLAFVVLRRLFSRFVVGYFEARAKRTASRVDDVAVAALEKPLSFVPVVIGLFVATEYLNPGDWLAGFFTLLNRSLVAFTIFWGLYSVISPLSLAIQRFRDVMSPSMISWLIKGLRVAVIFLGGATILEIWGIAVGPILAGLGLFGVAVALGAQDLFKNLIAGLFIILERRFHPGQWILVEGVVEGTIESIDFRTTRIRRFDQAPVFVPNSKLADNVVTNFSAMRFRRIYWMVGVEITTTVQQLARIRDQIEAYLQESDEFAKPPEALLFVRVDKFSEHSIDIMIYCFTKTIVWGEWLEIKERLAYEVKRIVEENGARIALPARALYMKDPVAVEGLTDEPEVFPLPAPRRAEPQQ